MVLLTLSVCTHVHARADEYACTYVSESLSNHSVLGLQVHTTKPSFSFSFQFGVIISFNCQLDTWEESLNEGLPALGWSMSDCLQLIDVRRPISPWV